jgi:hypothetical protein
MPPSAELDDEPMNNTTLLLPANLTPYPYKIRLTIPTSSPASYGLVILASRQAKGTSPIPEDIIPSNFLDDVRRSLLKQIPKIVRTLISTPKPSRDQCTIYSPAFRNLSPIACLRYMRAAALHKLNKYLTADEYR